ncbi:hypothetical protein PHYPO_G00027800 [Pangasianodon hypophthalmus]|uniref:Uncharacterized protein n=2 Tax=Pangasianodon TaxID=30992 RepID=A0A5N5MW75_PANHP|nr:hypothetical protein PHYPO_G00027800 [Pangasianodon hypophthalmus]MCI4383657.1 hypothetical protein [Pangasianodon gigas]
MNRLCYLKSFATFSWIKCLVFITGSIVSIKTRLHCIHLGVAFNLFIVLRDSQTVLKMYKAEGKGGF